MGLLSVLFIYSICICIYAHRCIKMWNALFIYTFICASCDGGAVDIICTKYIYFYRFLGYETQTDRFLVVSLFIYYI